jgi:hypothetical protein
MPSALVVSVLALLVSVTGSSGGSASTEPQRLSCENTRSIWELVNSGSIGVSRDDTFLEIAQALTALGKMRVHVDISGVVPAALGKFPGPTPGCVWYTPTYIFEVKNSSLAAAFASEASRDWGRTGRVDAPGVVSAFFCLPPNESPAATAAATKTSMSEAAAASNGDQKTLAPSFGCNGPADNNSTLKWLHAPKTGASFAPTMRDLGYCSKGHSALSERRCGTTNSERRHRKNPMKGNKCRVATLLRDPQQRLASNFYFNSEFCLVGQVAMSERVNSCFQSFLRTYFHPNGVGEMEYNGASARAAAAASARARPNGKSSPAVHRNLLFAPTTNLWACQAKMILGFTCSQKQSMLPDHLQSSENLIARAKAELDLRFDFIGNTESFDASVVLAHQQLGGQLDIFTALDQAAANPRLIEFSENAHMLNMPEALTEPWPRYENCEALRRAPAEDSKHAKQRLHWSEVLNNATVKGNGRTHRTLDPCEDEVDEAVYLHGMRGMVAKILEHHNEPVRFIDSSTAQSHAVERQIPTESSSYEKGAYMDDITRTWRTYYKTPDAQCSVLERWDGIARKAATSFHKPVMGNRNSKFEVLPRSRVDAHEPRHGALDLATLCKKPTNIKEETICHDWRLSNKHIMNGKALSRGRNRAALSPTDFARAQSSRHKAAMKAGATKHQIIDNHARKKGISSISRAKPIKGANTNRARL